MSQPDPPDASGNGPTFTTPPSPDEDATFVSSVSEPGSADSGWYRQNQQRSDFPCDQSGTGVPPSLLDHPRYRVLRPIGRGGMGEVYLAEHRLLGREVALKGIRAKFLGRPDLEERFLREIRAAGKLDHQNIVRVYDAEKTDDYVFLVMEYLKGENLHALAQQWGLEVPLACELLRQAARGVLHAHNRGVIHRDIKPLNLILVQDEGGPPPGRVKVLDFGLAKILSDLEGYIYGTPTGFAMGTIGYMSPEQQADASSAGVQADIFSLGRTFYYLLCGRLPYQHGFTSLLQELAGRNPVVPLEQYRPDVPAEVVRLIAAMTATDSAQRFGSLAEVIAALEQVSARPTRSAL